MEHIYLCFFLGAHMATWHQRFYKKGQHMIAVLTGFRWAACCLNFCEGKHLFNCKIMNTSLCAFLFFIFFFFTVSEFHSLSLNPV